MPHILSTLEFAAQSKDRLWQMMTRIYEQLARVINGNVSFGNGYHLTALPNRDRNSDNIDCAWIELTPAQLPAPGTNFTITHNLGRSLNAYIIARKSAPVDVYDGTTNPTSTPDRTYALRATQQNVNIVLLLF